MPALHRLLALLCLCTLPLAPASASDEPAFLPGRDYELIDPPQAVADAGRIEVIEVFGYSCGACASFQPLVDAWPTKGAADVDFRYLPAFFGGIWDDLGRAFLAADAMGVAARTHNALFAAIHVERRIRNADDIVAFYASQGVDADTFVSTRDSFAVKSAAARARQQLPRYGIDVTPTLIVAGKYRIEAARGVPFERLLQVADFLIAKERTARTTSAAAQ